MKRYLLSVLFFFFVASSVGQVTGTITDSIGGVLPFSSIYVKGTDRGITASREGKYTLQLSEGTYTLVCQHVGYQSQEKTVYVKNAPLVIDFQLQIVALSLSEVIVKKGEDPAYSIIRKAIEKREIHRKEIEEYVAQVYLKGQVKLLSHPERLMGQKVEFENGDTSRQKMLLLSESMVRYFVAPPNQHKVEVIATKVSGNSQGYGLNNVSPLSFYNNLILIGQGLNPRGFISPLAENALNYYRYKYEGAFFEGGLQISRIRVIPKRKYEPLFSGYINIVEDQWRIHSLQLELTQTQAMEIIDTLKLQQLYMPVSDEKWALKNQVMFISFKLFGSVFDGSFVQLFSNYNVSPHFSKRFFDRTLVTYGDSAINRPFIYWDSTRPIVLQPEEVRDYKQKDSLEQLRKQSRYLDSIDRKRNRPTTALLFAGQTFYRSKYNTTITVPSVLEIVNYNPAEGWVANLYPTITKELTNNQDSSKGNRRVLSVQPRLRYGFSNKHFNPSIAIQYRNLKRFFTTLGFSGGRNVFQFNSLNPINGLDNTVSTLYYGKNHMKTYEAAFVSVHMATKDIKGLQFLFDIHYQNRSPLENSVTYKKDNEQAIPYAPNYPLSITDRNIQQHQALMMRTTIRFQACRKYIQLPSREVSIMSKAPVFSVILTKALDKVFSSDVNYLKWDADVSDNIDFHLMGQFKYRVNAGGFLQQKAVNIPDLIHYYDNQIVTASPYLNGFQLMPYYSYSNKKKLYARGHVEYHLNGLLTNKIPVFQKLKWYLVTSSSGLYLSKDKQYIEASAGLENIFKLMRIDFVKAYELNGQQRTGVRLGINGVLYRSN